jgi:hypothetical protein
MPLVYVRVSLYEAMAKVAEAVEMNARVFERLFSDQKDRRP